MAFVSTNQSIAAPLFNRIATMIANVRQSNLDNRLYRKTVSELNKLSDFELNDLGLSRLSIPEIAYKAVYQS